MENQFGKYTLLKKLGDGGMAEVFLAEMKGPEGFSKLVAIKRILPHLSHDSVFTESFINEARLGGYLNHHNIVQTLDFGQIDGFYYLAMEYVQGPDLRQILQLTQKENELLPLGVALDIAYQICEGLVYAHQATDASRRPLRMIHRDLKPSNILINSHGVVKIADFGVARAESNVAHTQLASGNPKGTVAYMSPEQAMGSLDLDQRADVFSLGAILFELVASDRLYTLPTYLGVLRQAQDGEVLDRIAMVGATPGREGVVPLLERSLAKDRLERYPNSRAFAKDLRRALMNAEGDERLADYITTFRQRLARSQREAERPTPSLGESGRILAASGGVSRSGQGSAPQQRQPSASGARRSVAIPVAASAGAGASVGLGGQVAADAYPVERPPYTPTPTETGGPLITAGGPPSPTTSRSGAGSSHGDTGPKVLDSQTLRPREGAKPKVARRLGGTMMALGAGLVLVVISAIVTLAMLGRPSKVVVQVDPEGATITLPDGRTVTAPHEIRIPTEGLELQVSREGYEAKTLPIPGGAPDGQIWRVKLQPHSSTLVVDVKPQGASLTVNGLPVAGASPFTLADVAAAEPLDLKVSLDGYLPQSRSITLDPGKKESISFTLEPAPVAVPEGRSDDGPPSRPAPPVEEPAPPRPGHSAEDLPRADASTHAAAARTGFLRCNAVPKGGGSMWAKVFLDGKYIGNTPMLKQPVPSGSHTLLLIAEDGREKARKVSIDEGRIATVLVTFD